MCAPKRLVYILVYYIALSSDMLRHGLYGILYTQYTIRIVNRSPIGLIY